MGFEEQYRVVLGEVGAEDARHLGTSDKRAWAREPLALLLERSCLGEPVRAAVVAARCG